MVQIVDWIFAGENLLFALIFSGFCAIMLTRFQKWKEPLRDAGIFLLKTGAIFSTFLLFSAMGILLGRIFSDDWRAFLQFYGSGLGAIVTAGALFRDYRLKTRTIYLSMFVTTWWLVPSLSFVFSTFVRRLNIVIFGIDIGFSVPRLLLLSVLIVLLKKMDLDLLKVKNRWDIFLFEAMCLFTCFIHFYASANFDISSSSYICLNIWIMEMVISFFYWLFLRESDQHLNSEIERQVSRAELQYLSYLQSNYDNIRMLKHDLKNQYAYISMLYEQGRDAEAKGFFSEISANAEKSLNFVSTGNKTVDIAVSLTAAKAENDHIEFRQFLTVPDSLPFSESDLFSFLINLLDNAYEGTLQAPQEKRRIAVQISPNDCYLMVYITNTVAPDFNLEALKHSKKGDGHGYGRAIVQRIVEKYNGDILYSSDNGLFEVKAMLAMVDKTEENGNG